jgi:hypothetical protein
MYVSLPEQIKLSSKTLGKMKRHNGEMFIRPLRNTPRKVGLKAGTGMMASGCNFRRGLGF